MSITIVNSQDKLIEDYKYELAELGTDIIQRYILRLARKYRQLVGLPFYRINTRIIDEGAEVLLYLLKHKIVQIDRIQNYTIFISPTDCIEVSEKELMKSMYEKYPLFDEVPTYTSRFIKDLRESLITNYTGIANVTPNNRRLLDKLSNISIEVTADYVDYPRVPKKGKSSIDTNYIVDTQMKREATKEFHNKIIYFPYQFDKRGRIYTKSYLINFQSEEWSKAAINLAFQEKVDFMGLLALKKDIASQYGLDKETALTKLRWFQQNEEYVLEVARNNILDEKADKPILFQKACKAYRDYKLDKPIGYLCSIDSSASGIQIASILSRDSDSSKWTNLSDDESRFDIYTEFAKKFYERLGKTGIDEARLKKVRKVLKPCIMTHFYNSVEGVKNKLGNNPKYYQIFLELTKEMCKGPSELLEIINKAYQDNKHKKYLCWTMPDGFEVVTEQEQDVFYSVKTIAFSCTFKFQDIGIDDNKNARSLAPNVIHS